MMKGRLEAPAWPLAVARIAVFAALALRPLVGSGDPHYGLLYHVRMAGLPDELVVAPVGWRWMEGNPFDPTITAVVGVLLTVTAAAAALGWRHRYTGWVAVALAAYFLSVPQWSGKVSHYHHLLWLAALLASTRSADTLAVGRFRARPEPSPVYGVPALIGAILVTSTYAVPGLVKLLTPGWIGPDTFLRLQRHQSVVGEPPMLELVAGGTLLALATVGFQLSGLALLWFNRTRWAWAMAGIGLHTLSLPLLGIRGWGWLVGYPLLLGRWRYKAAETAVPGSLVGVILVAGALTAVAWGPNGWPFAVYPMFSIAQDTTTAERVVFEIDGERREIGDLSGWLRPPHDRAVADTVASSPEAAQAFARHFEIERPFHVVREVVSLETLEVVRTETVRQVRP